MKYKFLISIIAVIFIAGIIGSVWVLKAAPKDTVQIVRDGEVLYTIDLRTAADEIIEISDQGYSNTVEIKDHQIRMCGADCPDGTCVRMGWLRSASMPIVCLPHHLVIEYADRVGGDVDAVTR